ncbi:MAG TPA: EAL domain-containing protein [Baekduia sp.]|nr:EAL domain-containing protein [Baekduia sp.]
MAATVGVEQRLFVVEQELERSRRRLAEAEQLARIGSWEWDITAGEVTWSDELWRIYGIPKGSVELSYEHFLACVHPEDREAVDARNRKCFADHQPFEDVKRVVRPDGTVFLMHTQGEMICAEDGTPLRMVGVCEDVTDRERAREARELLASIIDSSDDAIVGRDAEGRITSWNPGAERLYGWAAGDIIGAPAELLVPPARRREEHEALQRIFAGERLDHFETQRLRKDGRLLDISLTLSPMRQGDAIVGVSSIARDITERKRFEQQLQRLAERDPLTDLFNRRRFAEELAIQAKQASRYETTCAVLLLDLDGLKYVNDSHGHLAGDELLRSVARLLGSRVRDTDVLARLGGDEFAVLLPRAGEPEAQRVAAELLEELRHHTVVLGGGIMRVTGSIGIAVSGGGAGRDDELLEAADRAMYAAKDAGRDRIAVASQVARAAGGAPATWEQRIRRALDTDAFVLRAQPIFDVRTGACSRYELLLRMRGPAGEEIPPGAFLPVAERLGLIHAIDRWVIDQAITMLGRHGAAGRDVSFAVNVSGGSVGDFELPGMIERRLAETGVDPSRLILEVTETAAIQNLDDARRFANALTRLGCRFALDDFGAGFGSFVYLKHLPADYLKIDGDFVRSPRNRTDELVIESIVGVARGLGKQTIAEWVTDAETYALLADWGVDFAQGHHTGRPMPAAEVGAHAERHRPAAS